jgi:hypothetical protein
MLVGIGYVYWFLSLNSYDRSILYNADLVANLHGGSELVSRIKQREHLRLLLDMLVPPMLVPILVVIRVRLHNLKNEEFKKEGEELLKEVGVLQASLQQAQGHQQKAQAALTHFKQITA